MKRARLIASVTACWLAAEHPVLRRPTIRPCRLISFFTVGQDEVRAWTITQGTNAQRAAGEIHSDLERGFIRAEVMDVAELVKLGSEAAMKKAGLMKVVGKDYVVSDGEVMHVRFNV